MRAMRALVWFFTVWLSMPLAAAAGEGIIKDVVVERSEEGGYNFSGTIRHNDTGWDNYVDKWVVLAPDRKVVLGERILSHPHVDEQPFTRTLRGVMIPDEVENVIIQAHVSDRGWNEETVSVKIPRLFSR